MLHPTDFEWARRSYRRVLTGWEGVIAGND